MKYRVVLDGNLVANREARWPCGPEWRDITFVQNDLNNLKREYRLSMSYDMVILNNVIDRIRQPRRFLVDLARTVTSGGVLIVASAWYWREQFTDRKEWLSRGQVDSTTDARKSSYETLQEILCNNGFEEIKVPMNINSAERRTERTSEYAVVQVSFWGKRWVGDMQ